MVFSFTFVSEIEIELVGLRWWLKKDSRLDEIVEILWRDPIQFDVYFSM